jgi:hypothetical protein
MRKTLFISIAIAAIINGSAPVLINRHTDVYAEQLDCPNKQSQNTLEDIISDNVGKYPYEINLFSNKIVSLRLKALLKHMYSVTIKNFNVQSPIVCQHRIYRTTGCLEHSCPEFHTTIYFDLNNDNINVIIEQYGETLTFEEKGHIAVPKELQEE